MEFSPKDLLSPKDILSQVLIYTQEMGYKTVTRGFIISQMNRCLRALSYDSFFNEQHKGFILPANKVIEIPAGVFNIKQVYLYSGDACNIGQNTAVAYWKRNYHHAGGNGAVSRNKGNNGNNGQDPFYTDHVNSTPQDRHGSRINTPGTELSNSLYYYGESNGCLNFGETGPYTKVLIKFNGVWVVEEDKNTIPEFFEEVLIDWCTEAVLRVKAATNPVNSQWRSLHSDSVFRLGYKPETFDGSWYKAMRRVTSMGDKKKEDLQEYLSRLNS